jgi:hypothetical protein
VRFTMVRLTVATAFGVIGSAGVSSLRAQELPPTFAELRSLAPLDSAPPLIPPIDVADSTRPRTYGLEGALVGGAAVGVLLAAFAGSGCSNSEIAGNGPCWDNALLGGILGFGIGGAAGALMGVSSPSRRKSVPPPEVEQRPTQGYRPHVSRSSAGSPVPG